MHVSWLSLTDFRSYEGVEVELKPGVTAFVGPNGQGKTNLLEALEYVSRHSSHRVASDAPLVRAGAGQAIVRTAVCRGDRQALVELEVNPGRANRGRLNRSPASRVRDLVGVLRVVLFTPDDLALVKGEPAERRRFLDDTLVARSPRLAGARADYDRVVRQRSTLLKTAGRGGGDGVRATLDVWDAHLARAGSELVAARLRLVDELGPHIERHYAAVAQGSERPRGEGAARARYGPTWRLPEGVRDREDIERAILDDVARRRPEELDRGVTLVGPHRDDLTLTLGDFPAKGYASHGESWSFALALRMASFEVLREGSDDPVLLLDDVFAELDEQRRSRLRDLVAGTEQVLVTAAVPADLPDTLVRHRFEVSSGQVRRCE